MAIASVAIAEGARVSVAIASVARVCVAIASVASVSVARVSVARVSVARVSVAAPVGRTVGSDHRADSGAPQRTGICCSDMRRDQQHMSQQHVPVCARVA